MRAAALGLSTMLLLLGACSAAPADPVPGVRLGMTPRDVRDRFDPEAAGTWKTNVATGPSANDDTVLEWTSSAGAEKSKATDARFEFHLGMLVAVRAHLREGSTAEHIDTTPRTVTLRTPQGGGTEVTLLARDCPTHHEEAESLAARASK